MSFKKVRVTRLQRIDPPANEGYFFYTPDGHCVGPFATEQEREDAIKAHYEELE